MSAPATLQTPAAPPEPPAAARRRISPGRLLGGILLIVAGVGWLLETLDIAAIRWQTLLAVAVMAVGAVLLLFVRRGQADGLIGLGIVLSVLLIFTAALPRVPMHLSAGERDLRPAAAVEPSYELGAGSLRLDLRDAELGFGATEVEMSVGMGELLVIVPPDVAVDVQASAGAGELQVLGQLRNGIGPQLDVSDGSGDQRLILDLSVGLGKVEVRR